MHTYNPKIESRGSWLEASIHCIARYCPQSKQNITKCWHLSEEITCLQSTLEYLLYKHDLRIIVNIQVKARHEGMYLYALGKHRQDPWKNPNCDGLCFKMRWKTIEGPWHGFQGLHI